MKILILGYFCLKQNDRSNPDTEELVFCNGRVLHKKQCVAGFGDWIDSILGFSQSLHRMNLDVSSFSCLTTLVIISGKLLDYYYRLSSRSYHALAYIQLDCVLY